MGFLYLVRSSVLLGLVLACATREHANTPARGPRAANTAVPAASQPPATASASPRSSPDGWRLESSFGIQIHVPAHWAVNDYGCNMSARPSVVRGQGAQNGCFTPEAPNKEIAWIGGDSALPLDAADIVTRRALTLEGAAAERGEGRAGDGRFVGFLRVPARGVAVVVKVLEAESLRRILDSAKLVAIDHHGCPERRPSSARPAASHPSSTTQLSPERPRAIAVCYYSTYGDRLQSSAELSGSAAHDLAAQLNGSAAGPNPDTDPKQCLHPPVPPPADAVLLVDAGSAQSTIYVAFSGCTGRGLDNGARRAHVSVSLLKAILTPLHTGYGFSGDLPP